MASAFSEIGVLVADRLTFFRHGLIALLRDCRPDWQTAEAGSFAELVDQLHTGAAELALVDLQLPGMDGVEGVRRLRQMFPTCAFVALSDRDDRASILDCLGAGAQGYVLKSATPSQFLCAIDTILAGGVFAPATLTGALHQPPAAMAAPAPRLHETATAPTLAQLTERQREVFLLLTEGCATKTIARRLNLAVGTVKVHLAAIYRMLGAHTRLEALAKARGSYALSSRLMPVTQLPLTEHVN
jgi:DNA-binding NarL/FixJ family response regulator